MSLSKKIAETVHECSPIVMKGVDFVWKRVSAYLERLKSFLAKAKALLVGLWTLVSRKFAKMRPATRLTILLVVFLSCFFLWQLFAYSVHQTTFVMVNLFMVSVVAFATCLILVYTQKEISARQEETEELRLSNRKQETELKRLKVELFELNSRKSAEDLINDAQELIAAIKKAKANELPASLRYQFLIQGINEFYAGSGQSVNCGVVFARNSEGDNYVVAGEYALFSDPKEDLTSDESLLGQVLRDGKPRTLRKIPSRYLMAMSGLGNSLSANVFMLPIRRHDEVDGVIEISSFNDLTIVALWDEVSAYLNEM